MVSDRLALTQDSLAPHCRQAGAGLGLGRCEWGLEGRREGCAELACPQGAVGAFLPGELGRGVLRLLPWSLLVCQGGALVCQGSALV